MEHSWDNRVYDLCPEIKKFLKDNAFAMDLAPDHDVMTDKEVMDLLKSCHEVKEAIEYHSHHAPDGWEGVPI